MKRPRRARAWAALSLTAALGASTAAAQSGIWNLDRPPEDTEGPAWALNYDAAAAVPQGPDARSMEASPAFQLSLERKTHQFLWAGLELGHQFGHRLAGKQSGRYLGDVDGDGQRESLEFTSDVKVKVFHLTPYLRLGKVFGGRGSFQLRHSVALGAGFYYWTSNQGTFTLTGTSSTGAKLTGRHVVFGQDDSAHLGLNFGTGLDLTFREGFSAGVDLRYHELFDAVHDFSYLIPSLRLAFYF